MMELWHVIQQQILYSKTKLARLMSLQTFSSPWTERALYFFFALKPPKPIIAAIS